MSSRGAILVTGATGKVGRNVVSGLLDAGYASAHWSARRPPPACPRRSTWSGVT